MTIKLGILMDPLEHIDVHKDSSLALLEAAKVRGWELHYFTQQQLYFNDGKVFAKMSRLQLQLDKSPWFKLSDSKTRALTDLQVVLMRKDPPFDMEYIYSTYLLELAQAAGVLVVNDPRSLRDANEKLFTAWFPECGPETLVTRDKTLLHNFIHEQQQVIVKPLDGMAGRSIFYVEPNDPNRHVIIDNMTDSGCRTVMAQRYIDAVRTQGDKRILLIDGEPCSYALTRLPAEGDIRGNLSAGARGVGVEINDRDRWLCEQIAPTLREKGLLFVGIDVIGEFITEINVTSPMCIREIDAAFNTNIADDVIGAIEKKL